MPINLDALPIETSFEKLKKSDCVYSKKYGVGYVSSLYGDDVIIQFSNLRKRLSVEDQEISRMPDKYLEKQRHFMKVDIEGESMSLPAYKRKIKEDKQNYVTFKKSMEILHMTLSEFQKVIQENNIQPRMFGKSQMINLNDLVMLLNRKKTLDKTIMNI